ncbi:MAG: hypothetical protein B1H04_04910 [Planctomycetales bacterium 4484_123]|nr:MAG: hypothetical protein B1H04_04910 [Planctomycetales bacterium 4484_123]
MVRNVGNKPAPAWKAALAVTVAAAGLLWHLLACSESPMAYSPSGRQLAFTTMEPFDFEHLEVKGSRLYRLMVVTDAKKLRIIEQSTEYMISAPAYSPDGKRLCYLRVPLYSKKQLKYMRQRAGEREKRFEKAMSKMREEATTLPTPPELLAAGEPSTKPSQGAAAMLPPAGAFFKMVKKVGSRDPLPATLVVRDAGTYTVVSTLRFQLYVADYQESFILLYPLLRPQYSPDGRQIYLCVPNSMLAALDLGEHEVRFLGGPFLRALPSPDGKVLAALQERAVAFISTDGQVATYRRWTGEPAPLALAWKDPRTLAILRRKDKNKPSLVLLRTDGEIVPPKHTLPIELDEEIWPSLAISPDGKHMVFSTSGQVLFMGGNGKVLKTLKYEEEKGLLFCPTFSPDSRRVAFKWVSKEAETGPRTTAIIFYSPEGKLTGRVPIPPGKLPKTRPTTGSRPATGPGK